MYRSTIAVYDRFADGLALRRELEEAGVPADQIHISNEGASGADAMTATEAREPRGILDWLFGVPENEMTIYRDSINAGRTIVKVHVPEEQNEKVSQILDRYGPVDVHADRETETTTAGSAARAGTTNTREAIPVVEEDVKVGKREVDRGGVRVRSYVVEQPFEELVRLRDETVRVERRPVSDTAPVGDDAFKERSFEVRERDEEAVVQKTARVKEEVVVSKDVGERTEQVRDKTRRTQVDVEKEPEPVGSGPGGSARPRR